MGKISLVEISLLILKKDTTRTEIKYHFLCFFISAFSIFSISCAKQNRKTQNPKDLNFSKKKWTFLFHYRLSSSATLLPPAFCFSWFFQNQQLSPCSAGAAGAGGCSEIWQVQHCRNQVQVNVLVPGAPWGSLGCDSDTRSRDCAFARHTSLAWLSNKPRHHAQLHWLFLNLLMAPISPKVT